MPDIVDVGTAANDGNGESLRSGGVAINAQFALVQQQIEDLVAGSIPVNSITNAEMVNVSESTIKGRAAGAGTGSPQDLTASQVRTLLGLATVATSGSAADLSGTLNVARIADGSLTAAKLNFTAAVDEFERPSIASPATLTLVGKMSQVADIRDWDAVDLTGANDEASIVQAAINETSGLTNPVAIRFPGCQIALGSTITTKNGTIFEGTLKGGGSYDTKPTYFHITHTGVGFTNENNTGAQRFTRINTYRTQPTPGGGSFSPNANDFDFDWVGAQDIVMEDINLLNPTKGIQIRGRTTGAVASGRISLARITGQPLTEGIRATHCTDVIRADDVHFWPLWSANTNVITYTRNNGAAFILGRVDNPEFGRLFSWGYQRGMIINNQGADGSLPTGTVSLLSCLVLGNDNCGVGLLVNSGADGATLKFGSLYAASDPALPAVSTETLFWCLGDNSRVKVDDMFGQYTNGSLVALDGTGNKWTVTNSRSKFIDNDAGGSPEFSVGSGNTLRLLSSPETSAGTVYSGSGVIESPDWRSFTPTVTSGSGSITTIGANSAKYTRIGKMVKAAGLFTITTNGTGATDLRISNMPFTAAVTSTGCGRRDDNGAGLQTVISSSSTLLRIGRYDNAYVGADGATILWEIEYECS